MVGGGEAAAACLRVYLVGQAGVAAAEERGIGELVGGRGRVGGEDAPEDGERGGVAARARVVGHGRGPRSRRTALAWCWCEEVAVARQPQRHFYVLAWLPRNYSFVAILNVIFRWSFACDAAAGARELLLRTSTCAKAKADTSGQTSGHYRVFAEEKIKHRL